MSDCVGISKGRMKIVAMGFPYRKKKGLGIYIAEENAFAKVATFNNDESAELFIEYLVKFVGAERKEE